MASDSVVCASCGARNRAKWEFCARCGESLQGATPQQAAAKPAKPATGSKAKPTIVPPRGRQSAGWLGLVVAILIGGVAVFLSRGFAFTPAKLPPIAVTGPSDPPTAAPQTASDAGRAYYAEGVRLAARGQHEEAVVQFEKAIAAAPQNALYHHALAESLEKLERPGPALSAHAEAARLDPSYTLRLARAQAKAGAPEDAEQSYKAVLQADPKNADAAGELAELLSGQDRLADAAPYYEIVVSQRPRDAYAAQSLAAALAARGETQRAVGIYRSYLQERPSDPLVRSRLAELLLGSGHVDEAIQTAREGLTANPGSPLNHRTLGSVLERAGRRKEAAPAYREYVRMAPNAPDAKQLQERADLLAQSPT